MNQKDLFNDGNYQEIAFCYKNKTMHYSELYFFDKISIYLLENMNGPLLTMLSGILSSLSINLLTNFIDIDLGNGALMSFFAFLKLISCLIFNISFVYFSMIILSVSNQIIVPENIMPVDKNKYRLEQYYNYYYPRKKRLCCSLVLILVFGILTIISIIISPILSYYLAK